MEAIYGAGNKDGATIFDPVIAFTPLASFGS